jgi:hypothetical protein
MMSITAMKQALEALEGCYDVNEWPADGRTKQDHAITALRTAIEQAEKPVAWMFQHDETGRMNYVSNDGVHNPSTFLEMNPRYALVCPLYTTPPAAQRTWAGSGDIEDSNAYQTPPAAQGYISDDPIYIASDGGFYPMPRQRKPLEGEEP